MEVGVGAGVGAQKIAGKRVKVLLPSVGAHGKPPTSSSLSPKEGL